jgi:hypothetical protein
MMETSTAIMNSPPRTATRPVIGGPLSAVDTFDVGGDEGRAVAKSRLLPGGAELSRPIGCHCLGSPKGGVNRRSRAHEQPPGYMPLEAAEEAVKRGDRATVGFRCRRNPGVDRGDRSLTWWGPIGDVASAAVTSAYTFGDRASISQ